jgi:hypothetical protein
MFNGFPVPTRVPLQEPLYQASVVPEPPVTLRSMVPPSSMHILFLLTAALAGSVQGAYSTISKALLSVPVKEGPLLITLIIYPVPLGVLGGSTQLMVPLCALLLRVPMVVVVTNEPEASESWAV